MVTHNVPAQSAFQKAKKTFNGGKKDAATAKNIAAAAYGF